MTELALVKKESQALLIPTPEQITEYLRQNPEVALEYIQDWLSYLTNLTQIMPASEVIRNIQADPRTAVQFKVIEALLEIYTIGTYRKLIDDRLANVAYRQSLEELQKGEKSFWERIKLACKILRRGLAMTEILQKIDSAMADLSLVNSELQQGQGKKRQQEIESNMAWNEAQKRIDKAIQTESEAAIRTSNERRQKLEEADRQALEITGTARQQAQEEATRILRGVERKRDELETYNGQLETSRRKILEQNPELALMVESQQNKALQSFRDYSQRFIDSIDISVVTGGLNSHNEWGAREKISLFEANQIWTSFYELTLEPACNLITQHHVDNNVMHKELGIITLLLQKQVSLFTMFSHSLHVCTAITLCNNYLIALYDFPYKCNEIKESYKSSLMSGLSTSKAVDTATISISKICSRASELNGPAKDQSDLLISPTGEI